MRGNVNSNKYFLYLGIFITLIIFTYAINVCEIKYFKFSKTLEIINIFQQSLSVNTEMTEKDFKTFELSEELDANIKPVPNDQISENKIDIQVRNFSITC